MREITRGMLMDDATAQQLIEAHFVEGLKPRVYARLQDHLTDCRSCRGYYDRLFGFEAAYDGGRAEIERIGEQIFARLDLADARPGFLARIAEFFGTPVNLMPVAAAACVLVFAFATGERQAPFTARGSGAFVSQPQLLGACFLDKGGVPAASRELARAGEAPPSCPRGGRIKLAYRGAQVGDRLVVIARGLETRILYPRDPMGGPLPLVAAAEPAPLPGSFAIPADAPAGPVEIVGFFGPAPALLRVERAVSAGRDPDAGEGDEIRTDRLTYRLE